MGQTIMIAAGFIVAGLIILVIGSVLISIITDMWSH